MSDFIVRFDGIKLPKEQEAAVNREIHGAVLRELAKYDAGTDYSIRIPRREWLGIWLRNKAFDAGNIRLEVNQIGK